MNWKIVWHQVLIAVLIGFAGGVFYGQWQAGTERPFGPPPHHRHHDRGDMKQRMLAKLDRKLHLSAEQKQKISDIFEAKRPKMEAMRDEMKPKFEAMRQATDAEIRKVLKPDQQVKFDEFTAEMQKRWKDK